MASIENSLNKPPNALAARCTTPPSRTGCQPVRPSPANGQAARCTTVGSPSRTGCQPVHPSSNALAARCTGSAFYYDFPEAMATANDHFFSRFAQAEVHTRILPHWAANSTIIFITYRLADSMPADKLRQWQGERDEWLRLHPEPWDATTAGEYYDTFPAKLDAWLDAGYGSCILAREDCRRIVVENMLHFNGVRYRLHAFVVMPNHVHVLVEIANRDDLPKIVHGWKSYTAKRMNEAIGGSGSVWQREYYDRLIRNAEHYSRTVEYIRKNGRVAEEIGRTGSPSRTDCQPVYVPNGQAARCTTVGSPSRTGCQPVQKKDLKGTKR